MIDAFVAMGITFFEAICIVVFWDCFLERKKKTHKGFWLLFIVFITFFVSYFVSFFFQDTKSLSQVLFKFVIIALCYSAICWCAYKVRYTKAAILSATVFLLIYFVDYFGLAVTDLFTGSVGTYMRADISTRLFYAIIYKAALFLILMTIRAINSKIPHGGVANNSEMHVRNRFRWFLYFLMPAFCLVSLTGIYSLSSNEQHRNPLLLLLAIGWLFMCFIVFFFLQIADEHEVKYRTSQMIEQSIKKELEGLKAIAIVNENYHEYQNDLIAIKNYLNKGNPEMALAYIDKLPYAGLLSVPKVRTGNEVVDAIVNQKYWLARSKDIHILLTLSSLVELKIDDRDLVAILSNMLDNAIEACESVEYDKVIQLKIVKEESNLIIAVKNPISKPITIYHGSIETNKHDKHLHGFGMRSIQRALDKYDACYAIQAEGAYFVYSAVIALDPDAMTIS